VVWRRYMRLLGGLRAQKMQGLRAESARTTNFGSCMLEIITSRVPASSIVRASWSSSNVASTAAPETPPPDQQPPSNR